MAPRLSWTGVAPSILSADFARLGEQVRTVLEAGATVIHVDVMDGHFVPPITMGPLVVGAIAEQVHAAGAVIDVHLMVERPERHVQAFADAGADGITLHVEATPHVHYALAAACTCSAIAETTSGPIVIGGTKCPSITSTWMTVAPASSTVWTCSPSRAKSADSIDGATPAQLKSAPAWTRDSGCRRTARCWTSARS